MMITFKLFICGKLSIKTVSITTEILKFMRVYVCKPTLAIAGLV